MLNVVNDNDEIIGEKSRKEIHQDGIFHREIHVYFITPNKELIFQHRAKDKETYPDLLDATVGGHVEIGQSYEDAAIRETEEETGIKVNQEDLIFIKKIKKYSHDEVTGKTNNAFQSEYLYIYRDTMDKLKIEEGKALGFESWPTSKLSNLNEKDKAKFISGILKFASTDLAEFIKTVKL